MSEETFLAYAEVDAILDLMEDDYVKKIPQKIRNIFKEEKIQDYIPEIDVDTPLEEQNLKRETIILLAILKLNYWCDTPEEKQELLNEFAENENEKNRLQKELEEKYNPDNLFKNKKQNNKEINHGIEENKELIVYKKGFIKKIFDKIKALFKKR